MSQPGVNIQQLHDHIVHPALAALGLYSLDAAALVLGTGMVESRYRYLAQIRGPALGWWQCEPSTHVDILTNYARHRPQIMRGLRKLAINDTDGTGTWDSMFASAASALPSMLVYNLRYAAAICRLHYRRVPAPLPPHHASLSQALYWKRYYNTEEGKGRVEDYVRLYNEAVIGTVDRITRRQGD